MNKLMHLMSFLIFFGFSCQKDSNYIKNFPTNNKIVFNSFEFSETVFKPLVIMLVDNHIIVYDEGSEWVFKVFSAIDYSFLGNIIRRGKGPEEEVEVYPLFQRIGKDTILYQVPGKINSGRIWVSNQVIHFEKIIEQRLPTKLIDDQNYFKTGGFYLASIIFPSSNLDFRGFNPITEKVFEWGEPTIIQKPKTMNPSDFFVLPKFTTTNPGKKRLALIYQDIPTLRVYCLEIGKTIFEKNIAKSTLDKEFIANGLINNNETEKYYFQIRSTSDLIFGLYWGKSFSEIEQSFYGSAGFYPEIHVFDWDGNPVMKLELDRPIFSFDVTPDNKQIIAISITDPDHLLVAEIPWD